MLCYTVQQLPWLYLGGGGNWLPLDPKSPLWNFLHCHTHIHPTSLPLPKLHFAPPFQMSGLNIGFPSLSSGRKNPTEPAAEEMCEASLCKVSKCDQRERVCSFVFLKSMAANVTLEAWRMQLRKCKRRKPLACEQWLLVWNSTNYTI